VKPKPESCISRKGLTSWGFTSGNSGKKGNWVLSLDSVYEKATQ
jgi:hypothetical protein